MDISEQCGYTIAQQAALFHSIRPLFANKPLLVVANKTDSMDPASLPEADKALIAEMGRAAARASNPGGVACEAAEIDALLRREHAPCQNRASWHARAAQHPCGTGIASNNASATGECLSVACARLLEACTWHGRSTGVLGLRCKEHNGRSDFFLARCVAQVASQVAAIAKASASQYLSPAGSYAGRLQDTVGGSLLGCSGLEEVPEEPYVLYMSTLTEAGVMAVKQTACDRLLASRVEMKLQVGLMAWPSMMGR